MVAAPKNSDANRGKRSADHVREIMMIASNGEMPSGQPTVSVVPPVSPNDKKRRLDEERRDRRLYEC